MPKRIERRLMGEARREHLTGKRRDAYVYGTLARITAREKRGRTRRIGRSRGRRR